MSTMYFLQFKTKYRRWTKILDLTNFSSKTRLVNRRSSCFLKLFMFNLKYTYCIDIRFNPTSCGCTFRPNLFVSNSVEHVQLVVLKNNRHKKHYKKYYLLLLPQTYIHTQLNHNRLGYPAFMTLQYIFTKSTKKSSNGDV